MKKRASRAAALVLAVMSMGHVGSPDTFFTGTAGPYDIRVSVRLPGVIPGRAQVAVRVLAPQPPAGKPYQVTLRAGQWNVGVAGAPPPETAAPVPGDPALFASELWFMTATSYQLFVDIAGPAGRGSTVIPVMALATAERPMSASLGVLLAALGIFLTAGLLTIVGAALRESVLPPGVEPDARRRRRGRMGMAAAAAIAAAALWGGSRWWSAEAAVYGRSVLYRPFQTDAAIDDAGTLTLSIKDPRWTGRPAPDSRYNALLPDHGKLMHLFMVREPALDALAHLHPIARTPAALDFAAKVPPLPGGHYRVYGDIVHESGYAQTLVTAVDVPQRGGGESSDPDDSWFSGNAAPDRLPQEFAFDDGTRLVWQRDAAGVVAGAEQTLRFSLRDSAGAAVPVEPYMGMAAHVVVASRDGAVFAHLHPSGSVSMAAFQKFAGAGDMGGIHGGHRSELPSEVAIPYAFPNAGSYRVWVQAKRGGAVRTAAFDVEVQAR